MGRACVAVLVCLLGSVAAAQVLARPGWAGSGVAAEPWWRRAVFYRVDPARFQDSNGDGRGDLQGIVARLDYLHSLGVDAVVLDGGWEAGASGASELGELAGEASRRQMRVLVTVGPEMQGRDRAKLMAEVRDALTEGVAGVWVPQPLAGAPADAGYPSLLGSLGTVLRSLPGQRVLVAGPVPGMPDRNDGKQTVARLTTVTEFPMQPVDVAALRQGLQAVAGAGSGMAAFVRFATDPATNSPNAGAGAALLLTSRAAAMFDFGGEIGLDAFPSAGQIGAPVMQWTPTNIKQAPVERPEEHAVVTPPGGITPFGAYRPYVRPAPVRPVDPNAPAPLPDPNTLPGFTEGRLPVDPMDGARINVATEDRDRNSLLNAYRELIALHHGNATVRNGEQVVLNRDAQNALVWVRRAPPGSRTVANVVVAANLGDKPVTLQIDDDLQHAGIAPGPLRALFTWAQQPLTGENTGALMLPAHAVYVGEIVRTGYGRSARR